MEEDKEPISATEKKSSWFLVEFTDLPNWLRDNEHLHFWHRPPLPSFRLCIKSMFRIHVETVNIWSHIIGSTLFLILWIHHLSSSREKSEKVSFSFFFAASIICMACSSLLHITCCHSPEVAARVAMIDYTGIGILVTGSFVPWMFYSFYCHLRLVAIYLSSVAILTVIVVTISIHPHYTGPEFRWLRSMTFVTLGLFGVVPTFHMFVHEGIWKSLDELCVGWLAFMAMFYIVGAIIYASRIPERFCPGKFDLLFNSHQLWHFFVLAGALTEYVGITKLASYRHYCEKVGTCHCYYIS